MESSINQESEINEVDPINDIIDYLVRSAKISFKNAHINETEVRTSDKIRVASELYQQSPSEFLLQYGKYLAPHHMQYFETALSSRSQNLKTCIEQLKLYHSDSSKRKRVRNRRFKAMQKLQNESDYFSEKQMMLRNPLLYEQLVGQYLTDEEIRDRDGIDNENLNLLTMILDTVDRNQMIQTKNEQLLEEGLEQVDLSIEDKQSKPSSEKLWGEFDVPDTLPKHKPEVRKQNTISAPERRLLREEFYQEMFSSFIEGRDDFDYSAVDENELYDDLQLATQDAEDKYFDSETNEVENLEEHMDLVEEYGKSLSSSTNNLNDEDPLDVFMQCLSNKINT